jgi:hypothetical protein
VCCCVFKLCIYPFQNEETLTTDAQGFTEIDLGNCSAKTVFDVQSYIRGAKAAETASKRRSSSTPVKQQRQQKQKNGNLTDESSSGGSGSDSSSGSSSSSDESD